MTRMDEAVEHDLAAAPLPPPVASVRARARRRRRRRAGAMVAIAAVVSLASVGVAASLGRKTSGPQVSVSPTPSSSVPGTEWCAAVSRARALQMGISYGSLDFKNPRVQAKLVASRELLASRNNALVAHARPG